MTPVAPLIIHMHDTCLRHQDMTRPPLCGTKSNWNDYRNRSNWNDYRNKSNWNDYRNRGAPGSENWSLPATRHGKWCNWPAVLLHRCYMAKLCLVHALATIRWPCRLSVSAAPICPKWFPPECRLWSRQALPEFCLLSN